MDTFKLDTSSLRDRALIDMVDGPVTTSYTEDVSAVITALNDVLSTELLCWLRYQQHAVVVTGINRRQVSQEFAEHADDERRHAVWIAERISQLGGSPDFDPSGLDRRARTAYRVYAATDLVGMLRENLLAERIVIQTYQALICWLGDRDTTTRRLIERILEEEEAHATSLRHLVTGAPDAAS